MKILSLDLEMNKEGDQTTDICQIGAVVGDLHTGEIFEELSIYIKTSKPLDPYIIKLTRIKQSDIDTKGVSLQEGYELLKSLASRHSVYYNFLTWGGGDTEYLRQALGLDYSQWAFGRRWLDVKTVFQLYRISRNEKPQCGLAKAMTKVGLHFIGTTHNAKDDAKNTFILCHHLFQKNALPVSINMKEEG